MAHRRRFDRAPLDSRSYRKPLDGRMERYNGYDVRDDEYSKGYEPRDTRFDRRFERHGQNRINSGRSSMPSELDRDFAAMKRVLQMLRAGAVRMVGEIGRQY